MTIVELSCIESFMTVIFGTLLLLCDLMITCRKCVIYVLQYTDRSEKHFMELV